MKFFTVLCLLASPSVANTDQFGKDKDFSWSITVIKGGSLKTYSNFQASDATIKDLEKFIAGPDFSCALIPSHQEETLMGSLVKVEKVRVVCKVKGIEVESAATHCHKALDKKVDFVKQDLNDIRLGISSPTSVSVSLLCNVRL